MTVLATGGANRIWLTLLQDAYNWPATLYFALFADSTEATFSGYVRKAVTVDTNTFSVSNAGVITNSAAITWATCGNSVGSDINKYAIYDVLSGSGQRFLGDLTTPQSPNEGDAFEFAIGTLVINLV